MTHQTTTTDQKLILQKLLSSSGTFGCKLVREMSEHYKLISPYIEDNVQPSSYDFTLNKTLLKNKPNSLDVKKLPIINPFIKGESLVAGDLSMNDYYLQPGEFVLGSTNEVVDICTISQRLLEHELAIQMKIEGKSSPARIGIGVENAGYIDPGFIGTITLEMFNLEKYPILLKENMPIAQGRFSIVFGIDKLYDGNYVGQSVTTPSRYDNNFTNGQIS